jgi:hypothetical protein
MYVTPQPGLKIPDPQEQGTPGHYLPPEGREVEANEYWMRRFRDGDVMIGKPEDAP